MYEINSKAYEFILNICFDFKLKIKLELYHSINND